MLSIRELKKSFKRKPALKGVSFEVKEGEVYGLLGHNGAGKSTTLGIILSMISADAGEVLIDGVSVQKHPQHALRKVGAIFESPSFYEYMSGWDNLKVLVGLSGPFDREEAKTIVEQVGLSERIHSKVGSYSHGMRQRLALAQSLLPFPKVLLLDEPTDGLDPEGIKWFRDFILKLREDRGITVLFNSHLLSEVEQMCDRVAIIRQGELVFEGSVGDLRDDRQGVRIVGEPAITIDEAVVAIGGERLSERYILPADASVPSLLKTLVEAGVAVSECTPVRRSLEDVYLEHTK